MEESQAMCRSIGSNRRVFSTGRKVFRPLLIWCGAAVAAGCLALGCTINPVVSDTQVGIGYYDACERAAENYCEYVVEAAESDLESCVANYTFQCLSGGSD